VVASKHQARDKISLLYLCFVIDDVDYVIASYVNGSDFGLASVQEEAVTTVCHIISSMSPD
jgi:hypothetical protein